MKYIFFLLYGAFTLQLTSQTDTEVIRNIYSYSLSNGQSYQWLDHLSNQIGSRLSGSLGAERAVAYTKEELEKLGLDKIFKDANFEWRESGCSMCLGMNPDILKPGERCASTSNRNFEGRQGSGGQTHLVSPVMAAAAAITGHFVDVREWS